MLSVGGGSGGDCGNYGGGGSGKVTSGTVTVVPGQTYTYEVGARGEGRSCGQSVAVGGTTKFNGGTIATGGTLATKHGGSGGSGEAQDASSLQARTDLMEGKMAITDKVAAMLEELAKALVASVPISVSSRLKRFLLDREGTGAIAPIMQESREVAEEEAL